MKKYPPTTSLFLASFICIFLAWGPALSLPVEKEIPDGFLSFAALEEITRTVVEVYDYEISGLKGSMSREATLPNIDTRRIGKAGSFFEGGPGWTGILDRMEKAFAESMEGTETDPSAAKSRYKARIAAKYRTLAFGRAREYLGLDGRSLVEELDTAADGAAGRKTDRSHPDTETALEFQKINQEPPACRNAVLKGYPPETASIDTRAVAWKGRDEYVKTRLGPLAEILLDPKVRSVCFSNLPASEAAAAIDRSTDGKCFITNKGLPVGNARFGKLYLLNLPISSYGKQTAFRRAGDGTLQVFLAGFPGKVYLRHFQLLVKDLAERCGLAPEILTVEDQGVYDENYRRLGAGLASLLAPEKGFADGKTAPCGVTAIVVGYGGHFRRPWRKMFAGSLEGTDPDNSWKADLYRIGPGRLAAVVESSTPWHGEILGKVLAVVAADLPNLEIVFAAGSAGSLQVRRPYSMVYPDLFILPGEGTAVNALSPGSSMVSHFTVLSPMAETPDFLADLMNRQVTTVDMEMGHLAENLALLGIRTGVALLATDFPVKRPLDSTTSLHDQKAGEKYREIASYPVAVLACLRDGEPVFGHPIERYLRTSLRVLSRRNAAREKKVLGTMTLEELRIFNKIKTLEIGFSFRLTSWRFLRILQDRAILTTAQVRDLKKAAIKPFTPEIEEELYGAYDYIFGTIGLWKGSENYGEVVLRIRPSAWKRRSFATRRSGWRAIEDARERAGLPTDGNLLEPEIADEARRLFGDMVFLPLAYGEAIAIRVIGWLRENPSKLEAFDSADGEALERLILDNRLGYLEGKIQGSMNLSDIEEAILPPDAEPEVSAEIEALARENGIRINRIEKQTTKVLTPRATNRPNFKAPGAGTGRHQ